MTATKFRVVALLAGEPQATELWTLRKLAEVSCDLSVIQAARLGSPRRERLARMIARHGLFGAMSRAAASLLFAARYERSEQRALHRLFDGEALHAWWRGSGITTVVVPGLNDPDARKAIGGLSPDLLIRVSGGLLQPETFSLARLATLNIHHGVAPRIRGMWSILWGLVENRPDWIGATIHIVDAGIDTGSVLWWGTPQVGPGDTGTLLFFRTHIEAGSALAQIVQQYADGRSPEPLTPADGEQSSYRSAPGLLTWLKYGWLGHGVRAPAVLERALTR